MTTKRAFGLVPRRADEQLRLDSASRLPSGDLLVVGWHPAPGRLSLSVAGQHAVAWRCFRPDVAVSSDPKALLGYVALIPAGSEVADPTPLTYTIDRGRSRDLALRTAPLDPRAARHSLELAFSHREVTMADVERQYRPMIAALEHGTSSPPRSMGALEFGLRYLDPAYYLTRYRDVASAGADPMSHWLDHGLQEGRSPHPLLDVDWYESRYGTPGSGALSDYLERGWLAGRSPSPLVNPGSAGLRGSLLAPLVWLAHELQQGRDVDCGLFDTLVWAESMGGDAPGLSPQARITEYVVHGWRAPWPASWRGIRQPRYEVDDDWDSGPLLDADRPGLSVIVPVHRIGPPMDRCVRSLAGQLRGSDEVIVVLDTADELRWPALDEASDHRWRVVRTGGGAGFAGAVNAGATTARPGHDLVLLNSDAVVLAGALDRLARHGALSADVASVSAISNNGSVASYPFASKGSRLSPGVPPGEVARLAATANPGSAIAIATALGHCFWVRREVWDASGGLDAARFPEGYGEENDWSLRVAQDGWKHLVALDAYVWHHGNASFGAERASRLTEHGLRTLESAHPGAELEMREAGHTYFMGSRRAYARLDAARLAASMRATGGVRRVIVTHDLTGGIFEFIDREGRFDRATDVWVRLSTRAPEFRVEGGSVPIPQLDGSVASPSIDELASVVALLSPLEVEVHSVVSAQPLDSVSQLVALDVPLRLFQHDYFLACPRVTMLGGSSSGAMPTFCGSEADTAQCDGCIGRWGSAYYTGPTSSWRFATLGLRQAAAESWVPSPEAAEILRPHGLASPEWPHGQPKPPAQPSGRDGRRPNVLLVGSIGLAKGAPLVRDVAALNRLEGGPLVLGLLGAFDECFGKYLDVFDVVYGPYDNATLTPLAHKPDVVWLSSLWPETHLYAAEDASFVAPGAACLVMDVGGAQVRRARELFDEVVALPVTDAHEVYRSLVSLVESRSGHHGY